MFPITTSESIQQGISYSVDVTFCLDESATLTIVEGAFQGLIHYNDEDNRPGVEAGEGYTQRRD
jgi:hypothetical protein